MPKLRRDRRAKTLVFRLENKSRVSQPHFVLIPETTNPRQIQEIRKFGYDEGHDTALSQSLIGKAMEVGDPLLSRVRVAQPVQGVTRIVLDTTAGSDFAVSLEQNPYRLVVSLRGGAAGTAVAKAKPDLFPHEAIVDLLLD